MIFATAFFDDTGEYRGVVCSDAPDPTPPVLNGKELRAVDIGCFDFTGASHEAARTLHESFEVRPMPDGSNGVAIRAEAIDIARRDLNTPATTEGLRSLLRARGPSAIPAHIGEAIALRMGEKARELSLPRPNPEDREAILSLFVPSAGGRTLRSIKQLPAVRAERDALRARDRALLESKIRAKEI